MGHAPPSKGFLAMETAVLSEHPVRFETFELNLRTGKLHGNGLELKPQGRPVIFLRAQPAHGFHLAMIQALPRDNQPEQTTQDCIPGKDEKQWSPQHFSSWLPAWAAVMAVSS
jgi:hypothetical protein